jgi:hypothetical protein
MLWRSLDFDNPDRIEEFDCDQVQFGLPALFFPRTRWVARFAGILRRS